MSYLNFLKASKKNTTSSGYPFAAPKKKTTSSSSSSKYPFAAPVKKKPAYPFVASSGGQSDKKIVSDPETIDDIKTELSKIRDIDKAEEIEIEIENSKDGTYTEEALEEIANNVADYTLILSNLTSIFSPSEVDVSVLAEKDYKDSGTKWEEMRYPFSKSSAYPFAKPSALSKSPLYPFSKPPVFSKPIEPKGTGSSYDNSGYNLFGSIGIPQEILDEGTSKVRDYDYPGYDLPHFIGGYDDESDLTLSGDTFPTLTWDLEEGDELSSGFDPFKKRERSLLEIFAESWELEIGLGTGLGLGFDALGFNGSILAKGDAINLKLDDGRLLFGSRSVAKAHGGFERWSAGPSSEQFIDFFNIYDDKDIEEPIVKPIEIDPLIGFSAEVYLVYGGTLSSGLNAEEFLEGISEKYLD